MSTESNRRPPMPRIQKARSERRREAEEHLSTVELLAKQRADRRAREEAASQKKNRKKPELFAPEVLLPGIVRWALFGLVLFSIFRMLHTPSPSTTAFAAMSEAVTAAADLTNTEEADNQMFRRLYDLTPSDYDGVLLYAPKTNMGAEELLLIHLSDASQEEAVLDAVHAHRDSLLKSFEGYGADQTAMLEKSVIRSERNYVLYVSAEDPGSVVNVFEQML